MSDLGSEELEEEGEKYLGVRSPGKGGGSSQGCADPWKPVSESGVAWRPATVPLGGPAKSKDHSGRCVLQDGCER